MGQTLSLRGLWGSTYEEPDCWRLSVDVRLFLWNA